MDVESSEDEGFVEIANELLSKCGIKGKISNLQECNDAYFINIYRGLLGDDLKGIISNPVISNDHLRNCQAVIDAVASDVLSTDLSHITGANIMKKDRVSIRNLLEIFAGLLEYFVEVTEEGILDSDEDDSNLLASDHDVISDILEEELGPQYREKQGDGGHPEVGKVTAKQRDTQVTVGSIDAWPSGLQRNWGTGSGMVREQVLQEAAGPSKPWLDQFERDLGVGNGMGTSASISGHTHGVTTSSSGPQLSRFVRDWGTGNGMPASASLSGYVAGVDSDISKVSDSTAELIKLGETSSSQGSTPNKRMESRKELLQMHRGEKPLLPPQISTSRSAVPSHSQKRLVHNQRAEHLGTDITRASQDTRIRRSFEDQRTEISKRSQKGENVGISDTSQEEETTQQSSPKLSKQSCSFSTDESKESEDVDMDNDLTQYTLQSEEEKRQPPSPTGSTLSASSSSVSWPHQISPLDPSIDGSGTAAGFGSLGVRPQQTGKLVVTGTSSEGSGSGRSSPVLHHHYHHHFHHPSGAREPGHQHVPLTSALGGVPVRPDSNVGVPVRPDSRVGVPVRSDPNVAVPARPDSSTDIAAATLKSSNITPVSSPTRPSGNFMQHSSERRHIHEPAADSLRQRSTAPVPLSSRWVEAATSCGHDSDRFLGTAPPRYAWADSSDVLRDMHPPVGRSFAMTHPFPSTVAASATTTTLSDSVFSSGTKTLNQENQDGPVKTEWRHRKADGRFVQETTAETLQDLINPRPTSKVARVERTEADDEDMEKSWEAREPPLIQRSHLDDLLAKYRRERRPALEDEETEESGQSGGDDDRVELLSDSAVDYGEKDSVERHDPYSSTRTTGTKRQIMKDRSIFSRSRDTSDRRPKSRAQRGVRFNEDVETIPITSRVEHLRRVIDEESREERALHTQSLRSVYRNQLRDLQREEHGIKKGKRKTKQDDSPKLPKKKPKPRPPPSQKQRRGPETVYCPQTRRPRKPKRETGKGRKRSASASPVLSHRRTSPVLSHRRASPVLRHRRTSPVCIDEGSELLPAMLEEFPFLHVSPQTAHNMWTKQARQVSALLKSDTESKKSKTQRMIEKAERRQESLVKILKKELEHNQRMRERKERMEQEKAVKIKLREKRQVSARARKYYDEYQLRMRARMLKKRTREEQIFKRLFEDGLEIQKQRIRELRQYAKEKREAQAQRQQNEIESMENYYRDQFSMLAENMARERHDLQTREKAQDKVMKQLRKELRQKMEHEVKDFQENLTREEDSAYFRQLEADRLRREFQLATNKTFF